MVVKAYAEPPTQLVDLLGQLERQGLASGLAPSVAPLLDFRPELNLLVMGWLDGPAGRDLIAGGRGARAGELAASWTRRTAALDLSLGEPFDPPAVLHDAARWVRDLGKASPELGLQAEDRVRALSTALPPRTSMGTRHASFSPSHVLDLGDGPGVIDWDSHHHGPVELEAGMFLASLVRLVSGRRRLAGEAAAADAALRSGVSDLVHPETLEWYRSAMLVKLAKYLSHRRPRRWRDRATELLSEARLALASR